MEKIKMVTVDGVEIVNTTPHEITFGVVGAEGEVKAINVEPCGALINAKATSHVVEERGAISFMKTTFEGGAEGAALIEEIKAAYPQAVIVGSIIAAQAYPGDVVGMCPLPGYERVAPAEKRMDPHKFTIF